MNKSQLPMLLGLTALLILTPLLSPSLRPTYLYFLFNLLIIALGAESGLLSTVSEPPDDRKPPPSAASKPAPPSPATNGVAETSDMRQGVVEKSHSEKLIPGSARMETVKKCPSSSSIFFIGEGEAEEAAEEEAGGGVPNGQELFAQAETFIGNFYKQLKMQREESWKNVHGFYQKGF